jgi:hypothetical protein
MARGFCPSMVLVIFISYVTILEDRGAKSVAVAGNIYSFMYFYTAICKLNAVRGKLVLFEKKDLIR